MSKYDMTIDRIKEILPAEVYLHWIKCNDIQKMQDALKELRWMLDNQRELSITGDLVNIYHAEINLIEKRIGSIITASEIKVI